jgi:subfamily B ATP-binding cassette protein MsbA
VATKPSSENAACAFREGRQRIAISAPSNAPILILDENNCTRRRVGSAGSIGIQNLVVGRTVFVIAHRLSTVRRADRIGVVENGGIRDSGAHEELKKKLGTYRRLYDLQFLQVDQPKAAPVGD